MGHQPNSFGVEFLWGIVALLTMVGMAVAAPSFVNFQGRVLDGEGNPLAGPVDIVVAVFDAATDGTELYREEHLGIGLVDGVYSILIGQGTSPVGTFDATTFAEDGRWLEVAIDGETLTPRQPFASVAYAFQSQAADRATTAGDADTVDGLEGADLDQSSALATHVGDSANPHGVTAAQAGAPTQVVYDAHVADPAAHHAKTTSFAELVGMATDAQIPDNITVDHATNADLLDGNDSTDFSAVGHDHDAAYYTKAHVDALEARIAALELLLQHVSRSGNDLHITGANLHIRSGSGHTAGAINGLGNLIVGYNEPRGVGDDRSGSHNVVVGANHNFGSYGGLVAGEWNTVSGPYASVTAGFGNIASGGRSSVSGGYVNTAGGDRSSVSGGQANAASGDYSSISGGHANTASIDYSSISGGQSNTASGSYSSVSGGQYNTASGNYASVSGGLSNTASGDSSSVNGGFENETFADYSAILGGWSNWTGDPGVTPGDHTIGIDATISGGHDNIASGEESSVSGGRQNTAGGYGASVGGGRHNVASGDYGSVTGGGGESDAAGNEAFANYSAILGGAYNWAGDPALTPTDHAIGEASTISGGEGNTASGNRASVSGGWGNEAFADYSAILGGWSNWTGDPAFPPIDHSIGEASSVSGGEENKAYGNRSSVSGGNINHASGWVSSVSGGAANHASGDRSSVSGGSSSNAMGDSSSVGGGWGNTASGYSASISGGRSNTASSSYSSVSGGSSESVTGQDDWRAGSCYFCEE